MRTLGAFAIFVILAYFFEKNLQLILGWLDTLGPFAPLLFLSLYCLMSIFCLPNVLLVLAGGALFGFTNGMLLNLLGATLGAICGFCLSRHFFPQSILFKEGTRASRLIHQVEHRGWKAVAVLRLLPIFPYNIVNYSLGVTRIKFSHYVMATVVFLIPSKAVMTYCGHAGTHIFGVA